MAKMQWKFIMFSVLGILITNATDDVRKKYHHSLNNPNWNLQPGYPQPPQQINNGRPQIPHFWNLPHIPNPPPALSHGQSHNDTNQGLSPEDELVIVNGGSLQQPDNDLTLDDILRSSKGQEIILKEAQRRITLKMNKIVDQISEEVVESLEGDAGAAILAEMEDKNGAWSLRQNTHMWSHVMLIMQLLLTMLLKR